MTAGQRIAHWRRLRGWSYRALSEKSGIHTSKLHRLEHQQQEPRSSDIEAIAKALGLSMPQFYGAFRVEAAAE